MNALGRLRIVCLGGDSRSIQFRTKASPFRMSVRTFNREGDPEFRILENFLQEIGPFSEEIPRYFPEERRIFAIRANAAAGGMEAAKKDGGSDGVGQQFRSSEHRKNQMGRIYGSE